MKKTIALVLCLVLVALCFGCTGTTEKEKVFTTGTTVESSNTYKNEYFDFKLKLDSDWEFYTRDEINSLSETVADVFDGSEIDLSDIGSLIDMMAANTVNGSNVNVTFEEANTTMSKYVEASIENIEALSSSSYYVEVTGQDTAVIAGKKYTVMTTAVTYGSYEFCQYAFIRKSGNVFMVVTFTVVNDAYTLDDLKGFFG